MSNLFDLYNTSIKKQLTTEFGYKNVFLIPKIEKVSVNCGIGRINDSEESIKYVKNSLSKICGQMPKSNKAKKSISGFKLREGQIVGLSATLRGKKMYDFLERLIKVSLPRLRDFRGVSNKSFDNQGNFSIGIPEHAIFPEINYDSIKENISFQVNIRTSAGSVKEAKRLMELFGFPFNKQDIVKE